jgi:hypothetical protein
MIHEPDSDRAADALKWLHQVKLGIRDFDTGGMHETGISPGFLGTRVPRRLREFLLYLDNFVPPSVNVLAEMPGAKRTISAGTSPRITLEPHPRKWDDVTISAHGERRDGVVIRVKDGERQGVFFSSDTLGFTRRSGKQRVTWEIFLDAVESPQLHDAGLRASIEYTRGTSKETTRKHVSEIRIILKAAFGIESPAFKSMVCDKASLYSSKWISGFRVPAPKGI